MRDNCEHPCQSSLKRLTSYRSCHPFVEIKEGRQPWSFAIFSREKSHIIQQIALRWIGSADIFRAMIRDMPIQVTANLLHKAITTIAVRRSLLLPFL